MHNINYFLIIRDVLIVLFTIDLIFLMLAIAEEYWLPKYK